MKKPLDQKPPLAAWATLARDEAGMSVEEVVAALATRGHSVTAATLRGIEGGSKGASDRLLRLLSDVYGKPTPRLVEPMPAGPDLSAVVDAIDRLTSAVEAQTREQTSGMVALGEALGAVLARLDSSLGRSPDERARPRTGAAQR